MSGNQSISGSLSVAGSIVTPTLTATSGTVSSLSCNSLSVTGSGNATFQNLTTTAATTSTLMATSQVSTPTLYIGTANAGTAIATLQQDLDAAEASLQTVVTKTSNQSFSSGTNTTTFTGTVSIPSTLMVGGSNVADRVASLESKTTAQSYNSSTTETAFSGAVTLNGGASVPLGKTLLIDGSLTAASATVGGALQTNTLTASGLVTANGGVTVPSGQVLTLQGNLSASSTTVTPAHVSRIQGLTSNAQTQLNALQAKTNNQSASGSTTIFSGPVAAPSVTLNGVDLETRLAADEANIATKASAYNSVLTGTASAKDVNADNVTVSNIVAPRYLVLKDNDGPEQSVIYQDEEFLLNANQYNDGHIRFAVKDTSSVQKIPLDLHYSGATFEVPVSVPQLTATNANISNCTLNNVTFAGTQTFPSNLAGYLRGTYQWVPIVCSVKDTAAFYGNPPSISLANIGITNNETGYLVFPRYKLLIYEDPNYGRPYSTNASYDNTNGTTPIFATVGFKGIGAMKVYFNGVEITMAGYS